MKRVIILFLISLFILSQGNTFVLIAGHLRKESKSPLASAASKIIQPESGRKIVRVTDRRDGRQALLSSSRGAGFNSDSTMFVISLDGALTLYSLDPTSLDIEKKGILGGDLSLELDNCYWSAADPNSLFLLSNSAGTARIYSYNPQANDYTVVKDFSGILPTGDARGMVKAYSNDNSFAFSWRESEQADWHHAVVWDRASDQTYLFDVQDAAAGIPNYSQALLDRDGNYLVLRGDNARAWYFRNQPQSEAAEIDSESASRQEMQASGEATLNGVSSSVWSGLPGSVVRGNLSLDGRFLIFNSRLNGSRADVFIATVEDHENTGQRDSGEVGEDGPQMDSSNYPNSASYESSLASLAAVGPQPPVTYSAITDRIPRPAPTAPDLGPAGFRFVDPVFGTRLLRVTDRNTRPDKVGQSMLTPSSSEANTWNTDSTRFIIHDLGNNLIPYNFDPSTMTATRIGDTGNGSGGLILSGLRPTPSFGYNDPDVLYGSGGSNQRTLRKYNFRTNQYTDLLNLDTVLTDYAKESSSSYRASDVSASKDEKITTYCCGTSDNYEYVVVLDTKTNQRRVFDIGSDGGKKKKESPGRGTRPTQVDGVPTGLDLRGQKIHNARIDRAGRYVVITPANSANPEIIWDLQAAPGSSITQMTVLNTGHKVTGYGTLINMASTNDGAQWLLRNLSLQADVLRNTVALVNPTLTPRQYAISDHSSWNNARPDTLTPVFSGTFRKSPVSSTSPLRAWDDEIIAMRTDGVESKVWRFAHTHNTYANAATRDFWDQPGGNVSQDGRFLMFHSAWAFKLGTNPFYGNKQRWDVFIVELDARGGTAPPGGGQPPPGRDTTPPRISTVTASNVTTGGASITWATDEEADSKVEYGTTASYGSQATAPSSLVTSHSVVLSGLTPDTLYHFRVLSKDAAGNETASPNYSFTTARKNPKPKGDTTPPTITGVATIAVGSNGVTIGWNTDELSDTQVEYGRTTAYGNATAPDSRPVLKHKVQLGNLTAGTLYHFRVRSRDAAGNLSVSQKFTFTTGQVSASAQPVVWTNLVNCVSSGNSLRKKSGHKNKADAGAVSKQVISSGSGFVEFTASETKKMRFIGLSSQSTGTGYEEIEFAIKLTSFDKAEVRENNHFGASVPYTSGDVFKIEIEGGAVRYYKNGTLFYTSSNTAPLQLIVDVSLLNEDATLTNVWISND